MVIGGANASHVTDCQEVCLKNIFIDLKTKNGLDWLKETKYTVEVRVGEVWQQEWEKASLRWNELD